METKELAEAIAEKLAAYQKEVLTSAEAARYMGVSQSHLYKLTMGRKVPYYKPMGKVVYFNRLELEKWLQSNRVDSESEIALRAQNYCKQNPMNV